VGNIKFISAAQRCTIEGQTSNWGQGPSWL